MKLHEWTRMERGRALWLAREVGVLPVLISQWGSNRLPPTEHCPAIERATAGQVTCEQLRPDVRWHRVPDADWPWHPGGRPLIDVTRSAQQQPTQAAA